MSDPEISIEPGDLVSLRAAVLPVDGYPTPRGGRGDAEVVADLWADPLFASAVEVASASLAATCRAVVDGSETDPARCRRAARSLLSYRIRATTRATPFGTFAGLAMCTTTDSADAALPVLDVAATVAHLRPGSAARRQAVADDPDPRLVANPSLVRRGSRLSVRLPRSADRSGVTVRATPPALAALDMADKPVARSAVVRGLREAFPSATPETIDGFVTELVTTEVLVPAAGHSGFDDPTAGHPWRAAGATTVSLADAATAVAALRRSQDGAAAESILCDTELSTVGDVATVFTTDAPDVLETLLRISLVPHTVQSTTDLAQRFGERFGRTLVPLGVAADPVTGIGVPDARRAPVGDPHDARRVALRATLLERARRSGGSSVEITDADLADLPVAGEVVSSYDMFLQLERREGRVVAALSPVTTNFPGGRAVGRFTSVVEGAHEHAAALAEHDRVASAGAGAAQVLAELDHVGGRDRVVDVSAAVPSHAAVIEANATRGAGTGALGLDDVHLGLDGDRLRLFLADGTPLGIREMSMVAPESRPDLLRMLEDLTWDGAARPYFSWGTAQDSLAHLPELTRRGVVIAREGWRLVRPGPRVDAADVAEWCADAGVARWVYCGEFDNKLLVDTHDADHRVLLAAAVSAGSEWVFAAPPPADAGVVADTTGAGHTAELVVTLRAVPTALRRRCDDPRLDTAVDVDRLVMPGGQWLYVTAPVDRTDQDEVLRRMGSVLGAAQWYWVRYSDADGRDQLRLRARVVGAAADAVYAELRSLRADHVIGDIAAPTHHLEVERYGGWESLQAYVAGFCVEARALVGLLPHLGPPDGGDVRADLDVCAAAVLAWLSAVPADGPAVDALLDTAIRGYEAEFADAVHGLRKAARAITPAPTGEAAAATVAAIADALAAHWDIHRPDAVHEPGVLASALHLFCNRIGLTRREEHAALLACRARVRRDRAIAGKEITA